MLVRCNKADDPRCPRVVCPHKEPHASQGDWCTAENICEWLSPKKAHHFRVRCVEVKEAKKT